MFDKKKRCRYLFWTAFFLIFLSFSYPQTQNLLKISVKDYPDYSRLIIESSFPMTSHIEKSSSYLMVRIGPNIDFRVNRRSFKSRVIESLGWSKGRDYYILNIKMKKKNFSYDSFTLQNPTQLIIDISLVDERKTKGKTTPGEVRALKQEELSKESPSQSSRGIKTIVIDPGHGGLETGAKGKFGTLEKDISLDISLKLKAIIERNLAFRVVLTRDKDIDVSLDNRAAIANNNRADLYISIHANSSYRKEAKGPETFFLSQKATDEEARRLAYLENTSAELEEGIASDSEEEIQMILWDMAQKLYLKQSSQLAESIQKELNVLLETMNRGIKQAPFKVLTGVACPAVLVEVAFISNPVEEKKLGDEEFQRNVAQSVYRGLVNYLKRESQQ